MKEIEVTHRQIYNTISLLYSGGGRKRPEEQRQHNKRSFIYIFHLYIRLSPLFTWVYLDLVYNLTKLRTIHIHSNAYMLVV